SCLSLSSSTLHPTPSSPLFPYTTLFRSRSQLELFSRTKHRADELPPGTHHVSANAGCDRVQGPLAARRGGVRSFRRWQDGCESRSEEHTSELQSRFDLVCRLLLEKKKPV